MVYEIGARHELYPCSRSLAPFKKPGVILLVVLLNSILIPLLYWALTLVLPISPDYAVGFMLVGFAAVAPFAIKAAALEKGDVPLMIGLVVLLGATQRHRHSPCGRHSSCRPARRLMRSTSP